MNTPRFTENWWNPIVPDGNAHALRTTAARADGSRPLTGRTVLAVFAHPDDESLACGGTLARAADAGARVVVMCATRGERGSISEPALVPDGDVGRVRALELRAAAAVLGISDLIILNHPDGNLRWAAVPDFRAAILIALRRYRPDTVITFGDDGLYWHPDHVGVHERTTTAVRALGADAPPLYYVTMPAGAMRAVAEAAKANADGPIASGFWGIAPEAFGQAAQPATLIVDVQDWAVRKLAALRCHRTQMGRPHPIAWIDENDARRCLGVEHFRRAAVGTAAVGLLEQLGEPVAST